MEGVRPRPPASARLLTSRAPARRRFGLSRMPAEGSEGDRIFFIADLDRSPRAVYGGVHGSKKFASVDFWEQACGNSTARTPAGAPAGVRRYGLFSDAFRRRGASAHLHRGGSPRSRGIARQIAEGGHAHARPARQQHAAPTPSTARRSVTASAAGPSWPAWILTLPRAFMVRLKHCVLVMVIPAGSWARPSAAPTPYQPTLIVGHAVSTSA